MKLAIFAGVAIFAFGGVVGQSMASDPPPEFIKVPGPTKVVTETSPPVTVSVMPDSCTTALEYADVIARNGEGIYSRGDDMLDIMSDYRRLLADGGDVNILTNKQQHIQNLTVNQLYRLSLAYDNYQTALAQCKEDQP